MPCRGCVYTVFKNYVKNYKLSRYIKLYNYWVFRKCNKVVVENMCLPVLVAIWYAG